MISERGAKRCQVITVPSENEVTKEKKIEIFRMKSGVKKVSSENLK